MTQCEMVLQYMKSNGCITPLDALNNLRVMRLAARIDNLKKEGHIIETEIRYYVTQDGKHKRHAVYRLKSAGGECPMIPPNSFQQHSSPAVLKYRIMFAD